MIRSIDYTLPCLLSLFLVTPSASLRGQSLYVGADQLLHIGEGAVLHLNESLENVGTLENSGEVELLGDWLNSGDYISTNGQLTFTGSQQQSFNHNGQTLSRIHIENPEGLRLESDAIVSQQLNMVDGVITAIDDASITLQEPAEILGTSQEAYINGRLVCEGTGYRYFPVGDDDDFLPLELLNISGNQPQISVQVNEPHPPALSLEGLELLSTTHYWEIQTLSGQYDGSLIRIEFYSNQGFEDNTGLVIAAASEVGGSYRTLGNSELLGSISDGSITSQEATNLPIISLGKSNEFSVNGEVLIPNAFAPDSPLIEDQKLSIFAVNLLPDQFVFRVFNRWGQIVYETESLDEARNNGWNGINQLNNEPAQFGTYSYYLSGIFSGGQPIQKKGTLTLFR